MSALLRPLEAVQRNAALGIRFWDIAGPSTVLDGLQVEIFPIHNPARRKPLLPNASGIYVGHTINGLRDFEFNPAEPAKLPWNTASNSPPSGYRIEVRDPQGRFLPCAFDADLPRRGAMDLIAVEPLASAWATLVPSNPATPPRPLAFGVPLFSAPSRPVPQPLAVVYAQLRERGTLAVPAWSLLRVLINGVQCGLGMADQQGRVAVVFPYPEPPRRALSSPPEARSDFRWTVQLSACWSPASPPATSAPEIPDLAEVLAQLQAPRAVVDSLSLPAAPRRLEYRVPMTARTEGQPAAQAAYLLLSAAP